MRDNLPSCIWYSLSVQSCLIIIFYSSLVLHPFLFISLFFLQSKLINISKYKILKYTWFSLFFNFSIRDNFFPSINFFFSVNILYFYNTINSDLRFKACITIFAKIVLFFKYINKNIMHLVIPIENKQILQIFAILDRYCLTYVCLLLLNRYNYEKNY